MLPRVSVLHLSIPRRFSKWSLFINASSRYEIFTENLDAEKAHKINSQKAIKLLSCYICALDFDFDAWLVLMLALTSYWKLFDFQEKA